MAQQMVNGSFHNGSVTVTHRMTYRYAVVNPPFSGLHLKPQDEKSLAKRKERWAQRNALLERGRRKQKIRSESNEIYTIRQALPEREESGGQSEPHDLGHQSGHPQSGESPRIQQSKDTARSTKKLFTCVFSVSSDRNNPACA